MSAHKPELDNMTPAQIRVLAEQLLYTMQFEQRQRLMQTLPGIYKMVYPDWDGVVPPGGYTTVVKFHTETVKTETVKNEDVEAALERAGL